MTWSNLIKDEVWIKKDYLGEHNFKFFSSLFNENNGEELAPGEWIRDCFRKSKINPTLYNYKVHPSEVRNKNDLLDLIYNPIEELINIKCPRNDLNELQLFLKSFSKNSFYDVHCEPRWRYGEYAFLLFLDDDFEGGELVFPDHSMLNQYLLDNPNQKDYYEENIKILREHNEVVRLIGPLSVKPLKNMGIVFKTGSAHWVNPVISNNDLFRKSIASWPFATNELISDLDKHCEIKKHFSPDS